MLGLVGQAASYRRADGYPKVNARCRRPCGSLRRRAATVAVEAQAAGLPVLSTAVPKEPLYLSYNAAVARRAHRALG
jgi:hypothetical protein